MDKLGKLLPKPNLDPKIALNNKLTALQAELAAAKKELKAKQAESQSELLGKADTEKIKTLKQAIDKLQKRVEELKDSIAEIKLQLEQLARLSMRPDAEMMTANKIIADASGPRINLTFRITSLMTKIAQLTVIIRQLHMTITNYQTQLNASNITASATISINAQITVLQKDLQSKTTQLSQMQAEKIKLEAELEELNGRVAAAEKTSLNARHILHDTDDRILVSNRTIYIWQTRIIQWTTYYTYIYSYITRIQYIIMYQTQQYQLYQQQGHFEAVNLCKQIISRESDNISSEQKKLKKVKQDLSIGKKKIFAEQDKISKVQTEIVAEHQQRAADRAAKSSVESPREKLASAIKKQISSSLMIQKQTKLVLTKEKDIRDKSKALTLMKIQENLAKVKQEFTQATQIRIRINQYIIFIQNLTLMIQNVYKIIRKWETIQLNSEKTISEASATLKAQVGYTPGGTAIIKKNIALMRDNLTKIKDQEATKKEFQSELAIKKANLYKKQSEIYTQQASLNSSVQKLQNYVGKTDIGSITIVKQVEKEIESHTVEMKA
jgi:hypothetical protein